MFSKIKRLVIILTMLLMPSQDFSQSALPFKTLQIKEVNQEQVLLEQIKRLDVKTLRQINNKTEDLATAQEYFPKVSKWQLNHNLEGLVAICRLDVVWTYLLIKYNIPKEISISFFIWETGWADSYLFRKNYNFGGIRNGKGFKKYKTFLEGVEGFGHVLSLPRYTKDYNLESHYKLMVKSYENNGYWGSEDGYRHRVESIEQFNLYLL